MKTIFLLIISFFILISKSENTMLKPKKSLKSCSDTYDVRANSISNIENIKVLVNVFKNNKDCIDGESAEIYHEKVSILLDKDWKVIMRKYDQHLEEALIFGVSEVWEFERSKRILEKAKNKCNLKYEKLCKKIIDNANP